MWPVSLPSVHLDEGQTEARDAQKRGPPIGDRAKIINKPPQRLLHLIEGPDRHHQSAQRHTARKIAGRRHDKWRHDREPSITGGDPGEACYPANEPPHHQKDLIELAVQIILFIGFAAIKGNGLGLFVDPHESETQIRLARVAFGVECNQRAPHAPAYKGGDAGIGQR